VLYHGIIHLVLVVPIYRPVKIHMNDMLSDKRTYQCIDVRDAQLCVDAVNYTLEQCGRLDICVNGAADNFLSEAKSLKPKGFKTVMEIDAIGTTRFDSFSGGEREIQRTMLELLNQLDGFDQRGNIKVLMATNRPDIIDPALMRPGRLDRKVEFSLPDLQGRSRILKIHSKNMKHDLNIRFELLSRLCPDSTGADLKGICTEAGLFAIRRNHKLVLEEDFLEAINKVIKGYSKFNATPAYLKFN